MAKLYRFFAIFSMSRARGDFGFAASFDGSPESFTESAIIDENALGLSDRVSFPDFILEDSTIASIFDFESPDSGGFSDAGVRGSLAGSVGLSNKIPEKVIPAKEKPEKKVPNKVTPTKVVPEKDNPVASSEKPIFAIPTIDELWVSSPAPTSTSSSSTTRLQSTTTGGTTRMLTLSKSQKSSMPPTTKMPSSFTQLTVAEENDSVEKINPETTEFSTSIIVDLKIEWNADLADKESEAFIKEKAQILKAFEISGRRARAHLFISGTMNNSSLDLEKVEEYARQVISTRADYFDELTAAGRTFRFSPAMSMALLLILFT
ncbi:Oidioi.mRNA.OKI2018_I69.chr2.g5284.t1.cds [Oikopleura dioica]|uniref:Oidioi.mRNA.OKI2018_I69.chr2.g5284.t1.cds n=1 Tax=Oikopleura dioica TaxID=34765 RepID=A0ABN7T483_OIKDI|nr:Oidioi.mRNA.OKI2018_I69.chr2.g5284.t1.cds [Oikopleura dioica]